MAIIARDAIAETLDDTVKVTVWGLRNGNADVELGILSYTKVEQALVIDTELARIQLTREQARALAAELEAACDI